MIKTDKEISKFYFIGFVCSLLFCGVRIVTSLPLFTHVYQEVVAITTSLIIQVGLMFVLPLVLCLLLFRKTNKNEFGSIKGIFQEVQFKKVANYKIILLTIAAGIAVFILNIAISAILGGILHVSGYEKPTALVPVFKGTLLSGWSLFALNIALSAVLPAVCEEIMYRGILLNGIKDIGYKKAIVITSVLFGLIHYNIEQAPWAVILGMFLALITIVCKSIYPAMIIHFMNNSMAIYLESARSNNWFLGSFFEDLQGFMSGSNPITMFLIIFLAISLASFVLVMVVTFMFKSTTYDKVKETLNKINAEKKDFQTPEEIVRTEMLKQVLEQSSFNTDLKKGASPIDLLLPRQKETTEVKLQNNLFLVGMFVLGGLITLFTYIWGLL